MHMADALLSPVVGGAMWAGTLGTIIYCSKKLKEKMDERMIPLMGVLGAFIFAGQMINFTIPGTGSSGHIGGGMLLAILLGPYAAFITIASVLTVQCLFFADGGILALGCNIWNLGVYPCFIAYPLIYRMIVRNNRSAKKITIASIVSAVAGLQLGAFSVVIQTLLSGKSELPFATFALMMLPIHLAIGLVEGFITAGVVNYVKSERPEILDSIEESKTFASRASIKNILIGFGIMSLILGGAISWFASTHPDGLEWSIEKIYGTAELPEKGIIPALKKVQEKTAFLPDYGFKHDTGKGTKEHKDISAKLWPVVDTGTSVAGLVGGLIVFGIVFLLGFGIMALKRKSFK
jgi:cobalt/nickel transport system permease protein